MIRRALSRIVPRPVKDYIRARFPAEQDGFGSALGRLGEDIEVVFDVGANVGDMTLRMLDVFPRAIVYSFEPCTSTFEVLRSRVEDSPHAGRARLFKHGFGAISETKGLHVTSHHGANSLLDISPEYHEANPHVQEHAIEEITLLRMDDFVRDRGVEHIDLVKIDVEGAEAEVISGARETLSSRVDTVFCEVTFVRHPRSRGEFVRIFQLMHDCGFAPAEIYDVAQGDAGTVWRLGQLDCVFRRF
jgi:FkbM family methyltransferase